MKLQHEVKKLKTTSTWGKKVRKLQHEVRKLKKKLQHEVKESLKTSTWGKKKIENFKIR